MQEFPIHGSKGGSEQPHTPIETPNNLLSVATAKVLMAVAEGELAGTPTARDIYLNGTPLQNPDGSLNFGGVKWEWRNGTQHQDYIKGLPEVSSEFPVNQELKQNTPWVRQITRPNLDAVRVTFSWNAIQKQMQNGDTVGSSVDYMIEVSTDGGPFVEYERYNVTGKTNTTYERTHRVELPDSTRNNWIIRARRLTPDSTSQTEVNTMGVKSYTEVIDVKQTYPNTALLYVEFDSRTFGAGTIPQVSVETRGRVIQVPDNYNPENRTYTGVWSGAFKWAWTDNPAWIYYDIVTQDRFGLGHRVTPDMVDKFALYEIAQYADVMVPKGDGSGDMEPRHTCNVFIQEQNDAWQVLRDIASIFNGMTFWDGNKFIAVADKEENIDNIPAFSRSNVVNGRFDYSAADDKSIYTSALISYDDPNNRYNTAVEASWERSQILRWGGDRQVSLSAIGCTSRGEAQRRGKYVLLTNLYNRQVSFQTGLQGMSKAVLPGNIIHVVDPLIGGRDYTGRIKAATNRVITLDRAPGGTVGDTLYLTKANGITVGRVIQRIDGDVVTVTLPYDEIHQPNAVWYLEASDLKSQLFRVTKVTNPKEGVYEINAVEYNESKYRAIDTGARLEPRPISVVPDGIQQAPASVNITSRTYVEQTLAVTTMTVSWPQTPNATSYEVQWRVNDGDWVNLGVTGANEIDVKGIYQGNYVARVRARNARNIASVWTNSQLTSLAGKQGTPPTLAYLETSPMFFGMRLDWGFKPGSEDTLRTEIMYSENASFASATKLGDFSYPTDSHELHGLLAGKRFWFWARIVDRTGNIGPWFPSETQAGITGQTLLNDNGQYNDYLAGLISETALDKDLYSRIQLIDGPANLAGSVNNRIKTVNDRVDLTNKELDDAVAELNSKIDNIYDALEYDPTKTYKKGDTVRVGQKLYQASKDVPVNTSPPNTNFWLDIGTIVEGVNGLAAQVELNKTGIEEIDGKLTSVASRIESITAQYYEDNGEGDLQSALNTFKNRADIIEERTVRANADEAIAERITTITASVDDNLGKINTLERTVADANSAMAERIDQVAATSKNEDERLQGAINTEQRARADALSAVAEQFNTVGAAIEKESERRDAAITDERKARVDADGAIGERITNVQSTLAKEDLRLDAAVKNEAEARVGADSALGKRVDEVGASLDREVSRIDAAVRDEATARVDADGAAARRASNIEASVTEEAKNRAAAIRSEQEARASSEQAIGIRIDKVEASVNKEGEDRNAAIIREQQARADLEKALATSIDQVAANLKTETTRRDAAITDERTARVDADTALSKRIETIEAGGVDFSEVRALIRDEAEARVSGDEALGIRINSVQSIAGDNKSLIEQTSRATANVQGQVNAAWTLKMEAYSGNQYVAAGIALGVGNEKGLLQSQFLVRADRFAVVNGTSSTTTAPFVVQNGQVFINDVLINKATITNAIIGSSLQSSQQTNWGGPVMTMNFQSGDVVCRHPTLANTYTAMNQNGIDVVVSGIRRVRMGVW